MTKKILRWVPEVILLCCIITTLLSKTGSGAASISIKLGYLAATGALVAILLTAATAQIKAKQFQPISYWTAVMVTIILGKMLLNYANWPLGVSHTVGAVLAGALLTTPLVVSLIQSRAIQAQDHGIHKHQSHLLTQAKRLASSELTS